MERTDTPRFAAALSQLAATFGKEVEPGLAEAYFAALEDLEIGAVLVAFKEATRTLEFFPRPVQLRRLSGHTENRLAAANAWRDMVQIVPGPHGTIINQKGHPTDEIANQAIALLGPMPMVSDWEGPWAEKRFTEFYEMLRDRELAEARLDAGRALNAPAPGKALTE